MLAKTVRNNLTNIKEIQVRSKAAKFSNMFQTEPNAGKKDPGMVQVLMKAGLVSLSENNRLLKKASVPETVNFETVYDSEISEYIVENPDELIVKFPVKPVIELEEKLPFFKSITAKLNSIAIECPV